MDRQRHVAVWLRMLAEKEARLATQANKLFRTQASKIANGYKTSGVNEAEALVREGARDWQRLLVVHYSITAESFIAYTFEQLGARKSTFAQLVQDYISTKSLEKAKFISATTMERIRDAISQGQENGDSEIEIANAISESVGGIVGEARSRTIARTEIHNAATYSMQAAAEETELSLTREWVSVSDDRTRDAHADADGQEREMDDPFDVDGELIDVPGDGSPENSINCRCTVVYNQKSAEMTGDTSGEFIDGS